MLLNKLKSNAKKVDLYIKKYIKSQRKSLLITPMNYGVLSGGKKIRSSIILATGKLYKVNSSKLLNICCAVECIHSYSLIHDDLPCMDNDKLRRGKPTAHIKFGESTAVLAGNSLLTMAFEILSHKDLNISEKIKIDLINKISESSGHLGIAGGQYLDLSFEHKKISKNKCLMNGIENIELKDIEMSDQLNFKIKLLGITEIINNKLFEISIKFFEDTASDLRTIPDAYA